jgi:hypothetical protein
VTGAVRGALLAAALAVAAAAAPAAADHHRAECVYERVERDGTYRGAAYGYILGAPGDVVSVSCVVEVFGDPVVETPATPGTGLAVTYAPLEFTAASDGVMYCTVTTVNGVTSRECSWDDPVQIPPQSVIDLLIPVAEEVDRALLPVWDLLYGGGPRYDEWVCSALKASAGTYGPIAVNAQGDVFLGGEPFWDCPPYDLWPSS